MRKRRNEIRNTRQEEPLDKVKKENSNNWIRNIKIIENKAKSN